MRRAIIPALLLVLVSVVLGATVFREQVAHAAAILMVREVNTDAQGNIKVHEQGTANVQGTVESRPTAPTTPFKRVFFDIETGDVRSIGPSSVPINITSLTVSANGPYVFLLREGFVPDSSTDCLVAGAEVWAANYGNAGSPPPTPLSVSFPTPLHFAPPAGQKVCVLLLAPDSLVTASLSGYLGT